MTPPCSRRRFFFCHHHYTFSHSERHGTATSKLFFGIPRAWAGGKSGAHPARMLEGGDNVQFLLHPSSSARWPRGDLRGGGLCVYNILPARRRRTLMCASVFDPSLPASTPSKGKSVNTKRQCDEKQATRSLTPPASRSFPESC